MKQPDLGKKIAELRKAKSFTQEELVEKCNLSVRTLQRIESGEVAPRGYTIKIIFDALGYNVNDSFEYGKTTFNISQRINQLYKYVIELLNLKTNKKAGISILLVISILLFFGLLLLCFESKAQKAEKSVNAIEESQNKINKWINIGQIDSILTFYREDACILPTLTGKAEIREMLKSAIGSGYKQIEFQILSISVGDSIAVQKYYDVSEFSGVMYKRKGLTEWRLTNGKWLIVNDIMANY